MTKDEIDPSRNAGKEYRKDVSRTFRGYPKFETGKASTTGNSTWRLFCQCGQAVTKHDDSICLSHFRWKTESLETDVKLLWKAMAGMAVVVFCGFGLVLMRMI